MTRIARASSRMCKMVSGRTTIARSTDSASRRWQEDRKFVASVTCYQRCRVTGESGRVTNMAG